MDKLKPYTENYQIEEFDYLSKLVIGIENSAQPKSDDVRSVIIRLGRLILFLLKLIQFLKVITFCRGCTWQTWWNYKSAISVLSFRFWNMYGQGYSIFSLDTRG